MSTERAEDMPKSDEATQLHSSTEDTPVPTTPSAETVAEDTVTESESAKSEPNKSAGENLSEEAEEAKEDDFPLPVAGGNEEVPQVNTNESKIRLFGFIVLLITFGGFGSWAVIAPLDSAALAPGVVTVKNYRKTVQHLEGGIVREIKVRDGEKVNKGQVLLSLDSAQTRSEQGILLSRLAVAEATEARLMAERDGKDTISFTSDSKIAISDVKVAKAIENEIAVFKARKTARDGEISVLEQRISQLRASIRGVEALISSQRTLAESYQEEMAELEELLSQGFVDKQRLREIQRNKARLEG
jgi:epimerase transport system membrane fusion protein